MKMVYDDNDHDHPTSHDDPHTDDHERLLLQTNLFLTAPEWFQFRFI